MVSTCDRSERLAIWLAVLSPQPRRLPRRGVPPARCRVDGVRSIPRLAQHLASFSTSNGDPNLFLEDEYTMTIFNATARAAIPVPAWHGGGEAPSHRRREQHMKSCHMCRGVSVWTVAASLMYGLTRCAAWTSCDCLFQRLHGMDSACNVSCRLRERGRV